MEKEKLKEWYESNLSEMPFDPVFGMVLFSDGNRFGYGKIGDLSQLDDIDKNDLAMELRKVADSLDSGKGSEKFFDEQKKLDNMIDEIII